MKDNYLYQEWFNNLRAGELRELFFNRGIAGVLEEFEKWSLEYAHMVSIKTIKR